MTVCVEGLADSAVGTVSQECVVRDLGRAGYRETCDLQLDLSRERKKDQIGDQLLFVEHPPTITLGRNADLAHILADSEYLHGLGITVEETNRGGDVTYHGPGQVVGYPILDLKRWRRDVGAYLRSLEQVIMNALLDFGVSSQRVSGLTGVWVGEAKIAAMGVHLSRWVTSHGFALNVETELEYFGLIVPCGLQKPVTSLKQVLGWAPDRQTVLDSLSRHFGKEFGRTMTARG